MIPVAAVATPPGEGAIAVVRITGEGAHDVVGKIFRPEGALEAASPRVAVHGEICDSEGRVLDEVLVTKFQGPRSYTGEDLVEISCHGGVLVTGKILEAVFAAGAKAAEPGEFTKRAFLNGKMDLTRAEAVMDLISAKTTLALRAATEQLGGVLGRKVEEIRGILLEALAHLEAWIDFPEEGISPETGAALEGRLREALAEVDALLATAGEGRILREGVRLAIFGRPNAGKSSLLNRLVGFDRAIVSPTPGTTRDTIEEFLSLNGLPFRVIDTAGLREADGDIEREGIRRARAAMEGADVLLEVLDPEQDEGPTVLPGDRPCLAVWNKCDLVRKNDPQLREISCATGEGIPEMVEELVRLSGFRDAGGESSLVAINARHQECLQRAAEGIRSAIAGIGEGLEPELLAVDFRAAVAAVGEIAGEVDTEELLGAIFQKFCIGK